MPDIGFMKLITFNLPIRWIEQLDELVGLGFYANRSEAIRALVRDGLVAHKYEFHHNRKEMLTK